MFFELRILLLTICISGINNFILNKASQRVNRDIQQTEKRIISQDVQNTSKTTVFPTLKALLPLTQNMTNEESLNLNTFDKRLSDDILIKRHIHEKDMPLSMFKSTKTGIPTPTLELKQKWPVVELLSESDEFKENSQYFEDIEKKPFPFFHDIENESKIMELPPKIDSNYNLDEQNNQSEEKSVGLRSLLGRVHGTRPGGDDCECENIDRTVHKCPTTKECTRTTMSLSIRTYDIFNIPKFIPTAFPPKTTTSIPKFIPPSGTFYPPMGFPVDVPMGVPVGFPVGIPANFPIGFPGGSVAVCPSGIPHTYYQINANKNKPKKKKPTTAKVREELYYDNDESIEYSYIDNGEDTNHYENKRKNDKKYKGDIILDITYDEKPSEQKISCNQAQDCYAPVRDCKPPIKESLENFIKGVCNDLTTPYDETIIKDWYCSSAYSMKSQIVVLVTLVSISLK